MTPFANYEAIFLSGGSVSATTFNTGWDTGRVTAATPHQIVCLTTGSISITPLAGDTFTWSPSAVSQSIDVLIRSVIVSSGTYVTFKAKYQPGQTFHNSVT